MRALITIFLMLVLAKPGFADPVTGATAAINGFRGKVGIAPLTHSGTLQQVAERHAFDMDRKSFFSHTGSDGSSVADRANAAGYRYCVIAENIAKGQADLTEVMLAWGASDGHRENLLSTEATEFGMALAQGNIWVLVLGRPGC